MSETTLSFSVRCRTRDESFSFTFLDHDGSVNAAAAIQPILHEHDPPLSTLPVVLTLHGTGVAPTAMADSYKHVPLSHKEQKDHFVFGLEGFWVLAPDREGAHNWETTGFRSALASVHALSNLLQVLVVVQQESQGTLRAEEKTKRNGQEQGLDFPPLPDPWRLVYAGHSMGGHGALVAATLAPARAIGVAPFAPWIKKEEYGDSNRFFLLDLQNAYTDPGLKAVLESSFSESSVDLLLENLKGVPVFVRVGGADRTVPSWYGRRLVRMLEGVNNNGMEGSRERSPGSAGTASEGLVKYEEVPTTNYRF